MNSKSWTVEWCLPIPSSKYTSGKWAKSLLSIRLRMKVNLETVQAPPYITSLPVHQLTVSYTFPLARDFHILFKTNTQEVRIAVFSELDGIQLISALKKIGVRVIEDRTDLTSLTPSPVLDQSQFHFPRSQQPQHPQQPQLLQNDDFTHSRDDLRHRQDAPVNLRYQRSLSTNTTNWRITVDKRRRSRSTWYIEPQEESNDYAAEELDGNTILRSRDKATPVDREKSIDLFEALIDKSSEQSINSALEFHPSTIFATLPRSKNKAKTGNRLEKSKIKDSPVKSIGKSSSTYFLNKLYGSPKERLDPVTIDIQDPGQWGSLDDPGVISFPFSDYPDSVYYPENEDDVDNSDVRDRLSISCADLNERRSNNNLVHFYSEENIHENLLDNDLRRRHFTSSSPGHVTSEEDDMSDDVFLATEGGRESRAAGSTSSSGSETLILSGNSSNGSSEEEDEYYVSHV